MRPTFEPVNDRAARLANLAWLWRSTRGRHRTHVDRIKALEAAGQVHDETYFAKRDRLVP